MVKRFIFIPVVNHFDLLEKAVNSVPSGLFDEYFIVNNSKQDIPFDIKHFKIFDCNIPLSFRDTQNNMRKYAIDNNYDYYCFMHNDGCLLNDMAKNLVEYADKNLKDWGIIFTLYDVFCAFSTTCVKEVGEWGDELWPLQKSGYYLDCDYYRRIKLLNYKVAELGSENVIHEHSNTLKENDELRVWQTQMVDVIFHYAKKWGGTPNHEIYTTPFNL